MSELFAQPYDMDARGFYFKDLEEYDTKRKALRNAYGQIVEEFEIQFIDGDDIDCALAKAIGINQANLGRYYSAVDDWNNDQKTRYIIAVGEGGYSESTEPDDLDMDIYEIDSMKELAERFVEEGLFGEIPEHIRFYLDYDLIARDLQVDYSETEIAGNRYAYRCG